MASERSQSQRWIENSASLENPIIDIVQIDGLVVMKLIKHCHEVQQAGNSSVVAQGALLGLVSDSRLEITHCFPFPSTCNSNSNSNSNPEVEAAVDDEDFQLAMMRRLRVVNVDHLHVGWYQSAQFGNFLSSQLLESHVAYQTSIEESVCLVFDTAKTKRGFLALKAFRLTPMAIKLYKEGDFTAEAIKNIKVQHDNLFQEVPICIRNSHLVNELMLELGEQIPVEAGSQFLDLGCANVLEEQLKYLIDTVDELNQECVKYNKFQGATVKLCHDKTKWVQRRQVENTARVARGEDPLPPEEDMNKLFKPIPPPSRLNSLILAGQAQLTSQNIAQFSNQALAKWYVTDALQKAKVSSSYSSSSSSLADQ